MIRLSPRVCWVHRLASGVPATLSREAGGANQHRCRSHGGQHRIARRGWPWTCGIFSLAGRIPARWNVLGNGRHERSAMAEGTARCTMYWKIRRGSNAEVVRSFVTHRGPKAACSLIYYPRPGSKHGHPSRPPERWRPYIKRTGANWRWTPSDWGEVRRGLPVGTSRYCTANGCEPSAPLSRRRRARRNEPLTCLCGP